jgi:hypothetical protein
MYQVAFSFVYFLQILSGALIHIDFFYIKKIKSNARRNIGDA